MEVDAALAGTRRAYPTLLTGTGNQNMARRKRRPSGFATIQVHEPFQIVERNPQLVAAVCLTVMAIIAICAALWLGKAFFLPIAVALVFAVILAPICSRIEWFWIPRPIAALLALILAGGFAYLAFSLIAEPASRWMQNAPQTIQRAERQLRKLQEPLKPLNDISKEMQGLQIMPTTQAPPSRTVVVQEPGLAQSILAQAQTLIAQAGFVFILAYFLLVTREEFRIKFIASQPSLRGRVRAARVFRDVGRRVSGYIVTFSIINVFVGVGAGLACWQLGLPEPLMWGGLAALLNFIPFLGPVITMALLGLAGLATFDTLLEASFPVLAFMAISFLEANLITPTIVGRRMTLNPLAIILVVSFWIWLWGPVGGVIGLPLLIMFKVICDHTPPLRVVGALIGAPLVRAAKDDASHDGRLKIIVEQPGLAAREPDALPARQIDAIAARVQTPT
jgi:predicted PurR-regulated permease PerM